MDARQQRPAYAHRAMEYAVMTMIYPHIDQLRIAGNEAVVLMRSASWRVIAEISHDHSKGYRIVGETQWVIGVQTSINATRTPKRTLH